MKDKKNYQVMQKLNNRVGNSQTLQCVRSGLIMMIPVLLTGSFTLVCRSLPIPAYQNFINEFLSGALYNLLTAVYNATFGFLSVYMTAAVSLCYTRQKRFEQTLDYWPLFTSIGCFCLFSGMFTGNFTTEAFGVKGMFTAIVCALFASSLYYRVSKLLSHRVTFYADGANGDFNSAISAVAPMIIVLMMFALLDFALIKIFNVESFQALFIRLINGFFANMGRTLGTMLLYTLLSGLLWFFGIHGGDVLESVSANIFKPAVELNAAAVAAGGAPTEIFSKTFFDVFVVMGGCGASLCLLIAVFLFSKRRGNKNLCRFAAIPMLFNINEPLVFGLPIVFNPVLLAPFLLTPLVIVVTSFAAMSLGLVPLAVTEVEWTTPVLLGGYLATGSASGAVLQLVNLCIGVLIYFPFVKMYDKSQLNYAHGRMQKVLDIFKQAEADNRHVELLSMTDSAVTVSRTLVEDIRFRLRKRFPAMHYQPQYDSAGNCVGAEALLRWSHPLYGTVYPPLIISLAQEAGILLQLEKKIFRSVFEDLKELERVLPKGAKASVNVTGTTIQTEEFERFLAGMKDEYPVCARLICIEITERTELDFNDRLIARLSRICKMGYSFAIDDFSMGSTSIKYLETNVFELVKLDGALSKNVLGNPRSREIISSIVDLSDAFGISVLAEFVETERQKEALEKCGCLLYQGYLYSPAIPIDELDKRLSGDLPQKGE